MTSSPCPQPLPWDTSTGPRIPGLKDPGQPLFPVPRRPGRTLPSALPRPAPSWAPAHLPPPARAPGARFWPRPPAAAGFSQTPASWSAPGSGPGPRSPAPFPPPACPRDLSLPAGPPPGPRTPLSQALGPPSSLPLLPPPPAAAASSCSHPLWLWNSWWNLLRPPPPALGVCTKPRESAGPGYWRRCRVRRGTWLRRQSWPWPYLRCFNLHTCVFLIQLCLYTGV